MIYLLNKYLEGNTIKTYTICGSMHFAKQMNEIAYYLETQSCNVRAIDFYRKQGFQLIGYDSCCYTNIDIEKHEIRFDFGFFLHKKPGRFEE